VAEEHEATGKHVIFDLNDCECGFDLLNNGDYIREVIIESCKLANATLRKKKNGDYAGVSHIHKQEKRRKNIIYSLRTDMRCTAGPDSKNDSSEDGYGRSCDFRLRRSIYFDTSDRLQQPWKDACNFILIF